MICFSPPYFTSGTTGEGSTANRTTGDLLALSKVLVADSSGTCQAFFEIEAPVPPSATRVDAFTTLSVTFDVSAFTTWPGGYANASAAVFIRLFQQIQPATGNPIVFDSGMITFNLYDAHAAFIWTETGQSTISIPLDAGFNRPPSLPLDMGLVPNTAIITVGLQTFAIAGGVAGAFAEATTQMTSCCLKTV